MVKFRKLIEAMDRCIGSSICACQDCPYAKDDDGMIRTCEALLRDSKRALQEAEKKLCDKSDEDFKIEVGHSYRIDFDRNNADMNFSYDFGLLYISPSYKGNSSERPKGTICYEDARVTYYHIFFTAMTSRIRYSFEYDEDHCKWKCLDIYDPKS